MAIEIVTFRITGISPLMQSNATSLLNEQHSVKSGLTVKQTYDHAQEAKIRTYPQEGGLFGHPSSAFRRAMMNAVSGRKLAKKSARMVIAGAVFPVEEFVTILGKDGKPAKKYEVDIRPAVVKSGASRNRIIRARPKFFPWGCDLPLELDSELISPAQVLEALNLAGRIIGVGEFRPDPSEGKSGIGTCGRFTAETR